MNVGPHLLGRRPSAPDHRDYPLRAFLAPTNSLDEALATLLKSHAAQATKAWCVLATPLITGAPPPPPLTPTPEPTLWSDSERVLDQGDTGHCVGFAGAQWGNTLPIDDRFANESGDDIYYECKVIDGEPLGEEGTDVRSVAKALKARGRLSTYAFGTVSDALAFLPQGPVIMGTDWTESMFSPNSDGVVIPSGDPVGGHCYVLVGYDPSNDRLRFRNSWGDRWGIGGDFFINRSHYERLFRRNGEALAAVELPL